MKHLLGLAVATLFAAVLVGILGCSSSPSAGKALLADPGAGLGGAWSGVALMSPEPMHLEMVLSPRAGDGRVAAFDGVLRGQPLRSYLDGRDFGAAGDLPATDVVLVLDEASHGLIVRGARGTIGGRRGVFDAPGQRLALIDGGRQAGLGSAISFVRPGAFRSMAKGYKTFNKRSSGGARGLFKLLTLSFAPSDKKLRNWIQPALDALPDGALAGGVSGQVERMAIPLFEDEHFERTFGATFDRLSGKKLNAIFRDLGKNRFRGGSEAERSLAALHRMFWTHIGNPAGIHTLQGLHALRGVQGWRKAQTRRLAGIGGASEGWENDWANAEAILAFAPGAPASWAWPQDTEALMAEATSALGEMAYPVLASELAELEEGSDQAALRGLVSFSRGASKPWRYVEEAQAAALRTQAADRIEAVSASLIGARVQQLAQLGEGLDAITRGNEWMQRFERDFGDVRATSAYGEALARLNERRGSDLVAARPEMLAAVAQSSSGTVDGWVGTWFQAPGDRTHAVVGAVRQAVVARKQELNANYERGIQEAVAQARVESQSRPQQPLRYIDFRRFPSAEFLEFIYYGTGKNQTQAEFLSSFARQDLSGIWDMAKYTSKMKLAFANYHDLYCRRYGSTPAARNASGERWRGIVHATTTINEFGNVTDQRVDTEPFVYVRDSYSEAYKKTLVNEADGVVLLLGALIGAAEQGGSQSQMRRQFEQNLFGGILLTPTEYQSAFTKFLDEYKEAYPATVRHFEENLRRAFQLELLRKIDVIRVTK